EDGIRDRNVTGVQTCALPISVFLAAISVAAIGMIGFVGLIVPHMARLIVGSNYIYLLPMSMVLGALVLLLADTVGRTALTPLDKIGRASCRECMKSRRRDIVF